ncbi:spermine oxidase-like, partial [Penaeus japonicus]|uniref:spermine oxidase-like n=1 Tax=Penaeus japonicus TaxID=27405 RepID=UPI001C7114FC
VLSCLYSRAMPLYSRHLFLPPEIKGVTASKCRVREQSTGYNLHSTTILITTYIIFMDKCSSNRDASRAKTLVDLPDGDRCSRAERVGVVIVGGGVAGLTAAKTLLDKGVKDFVVLEAQDRLGGRVHTIRQGPVLVEAGAEWIHGGEKNPLYRLASSLRAVGGAAPEDVQEDRRVMTQDGEPSDPAPCDRVVTALMTECDNNGILEPYYNTGYGQYYVDRFPDVYGPGHDGAKGRAWLHLLEQMVKGEEGIDSWMDISALDADEYIDLGEDYNWADGFDTLVRHLEESIPKGHIRLNSPVSRILWNRSDDEVEVMTSDEGEASYITSVVLVTVSLGFLKEEHENIFRPVLPDHFARNLQLAELGVANKMQLGWPRTWWGTGPLQLFILWTSFDLDSDMDWLYSIVCIESVYNQAAVLEMFIMGENSRRMEKLPENTVRDHLLYLLRRVTKQDVPRPTFFNRTTWGSNRWTRGSYSSFVSVAGARAGLRRREALATPIANANGKTVVTWAGEHTHNTRYGTVDGAMATGEREAHRILNILNANQ